MSVGSIFKVGGSSFNFTQTAGTTTVNGTLASAGAGTLNLNGGLLLGTGTLDYGVVDAATINPGATSTSTGKLQVDGTYAQNSAGALAVTIGGTTAGTKFDQLNVTGTASLNGSLKISLASGYTPAVGDTFNILNASSISGNFATITGLGINANEHFAVTTVNGDEILLTVVSGPATTNSVKPAQFTHGGRYSRAVYSGPRQSALVSGPAVAAVPVVPRVPLASGRLSLGGRGLRPMDQFGSPVAVSAPVITGDSSAVAALATAPASAAAYNSMSGMNHMHFECGIDLKALLKTSRKQLLKGLWAGPESPNALAIGYMAYTSAH